MLGPSVPSSTAAAVALAATEGLEKRSRCERLRSRVAGLVNLEEEKTSPRKLATGLRGSSSVSRASAAMARPGGPSQKSSWRHEETVTVPCRMEKL